MLVNYLLTLQVKQVRVSRYVHYAPKWLTDCLYQWASFIWIFLLRSLIVISRLAHFRREWTIFYCGDYILSVDSAKYKIISVMFTYSL